MTIYVFAEGKTEEKVLEGIKKQVLTDLAYEPHTCKGKDQVNRKMVTTLGPLFKSPPERSDLIKCLVLRDLDQHVGETIGSIVQSVSNAVGHMLSERIPGAPQVTLAQHHSFDSVYTFTLSLDQLNFRLALHIATKRWNDSFIKATIDDYVLSLAFQAGTVQNLVQQKGWNVPFGKVLRKVEIEIPELLRQNQIPLQEAKDYVRLYAAVIQEHTSPAVFAEKVLAHANKDEIQSVFQPLMAAIDFLRS